MLKSCPNPVEVQDLQFKLHCRLKVFDNNGLDTFPNSYSLISCASRYGLLFVGSNSTNLQVIQLKCVENYSPKDKNISNYPKRNISLPSVPKHVCVNCDSTILAVVTEKDKCPVVIFYSVLSFLKQNITVIKEARLSPTPGIYVTEINWNPALPPVFTACKSDGTLGIYEIKDNSVDINELPSAAEATSFCWSPKGKQLAVGSKNGKITQYKPDLKAVKVINEPPLGGSHSLISLQWVSNYQFIGVYRSVDPNIPTKLIVVDAPKTGEPSYINYDDVCYSGSTRLPQFFMILQQHWNILMVASSNSAEVGILGASGDNWTQWILPDSARAELPLSSNHQETLPVGLALDISSTKPLPWNESSVPPCPYLLILSHHGVLCIFSIVNLKQGIPSICTPPDPIPDMSGVGQFVIISETVSAAQIVPETPKTTFSFAAAGPNPAISQAAFGATVLTQPQPTYGTPSSVFGAKTTAENKPLFGGQAVLTPINPHQPTTQSSVFGAQTFITPISKPQTDVTSTSAVSDKYSSIFSALNAPTPAPVPSQSKPIIISTRPIAKSVESAAEQQIVVQPKTPTTTKPTESLTSVDAKIKSETDPLLAQMVKDECVFLESELQAILHQGRSIKIDIGSDTDKVEMISQINYLQQFIKEVIDISIAENAEVHYLKQSLIQSWAWFEEARSRYNSSKDETVSLLLRAQPLDSATEKRQADIRKLIYYIESQITQASKALDEQWDNFQDYAKKTYRTQMPTMETIFQTMVRQNAIIQRQSYVMKDIASRLKNKTRSTNGLSLLISMGNVEDLEDDLKRLQLQQPEDICQTQYERVLNRMKNLSECKTSRLRQLLKNREVLHVTVVKPQITSSLMLQSPANKKLVSDLQLSRVTRTGAVPKILNFLHSTPIHENTTDMKPTAAFPETPSKGFAFTKVEKSNSALNLITTSSSFVPLSKSTSVFSNLPQDHSTQSTLPTHTPSAFVPTTQVAFGSANKPFSFPSATTATTTVLKTGSTPATSASDLAVSTLPKFLSVQPKTTSSIDAAATSMKMSTPVVKTSLPQFGFGSSISITPISTTKKVESTSAPTTASSFGSVASTKPTFSFSNASNLFGVKPGVDSDNIVNKIVTPGTVTTSTATHFTTLSVPGSKPLFGSTATNSGTFTFGAVSGTTKASAFIALTTYSTSTSLTAPSISLTSISEPKTVTSTPTSVMQPSMLVINPAAANMTAKTLAPTFASLANTASTSTTPAITVPTFGSSITSTKTQSTFESPTVPSAPDTSSTITSSIPIFGGSTVTKPSLSFNTGLTITTQSTINSSSPSVFSSPNAAAKPSVFGSTVTSSISNNVITTSTKPSISTSSAAAALTTTQSPVIDSTTTAGMVITTQTTSIFGTQKINSAAKLSPFGSATRPTQLSIFGSSDPTKTPQTSIFGGTTNSTTQSSIFGTPTTATTSKPSVFGSAVTSSQPSIFGGATSSTTQSSIFGSATTAGISKPTVFGAADTSTQPSIFGGAAGSTTQSSIFETVTITDPTNVSVFRTAGTAPQPPIFGGAAGGSTAQSSIFGTSNTITASKPSVFGLAVTSTQSSIFGGSTGGGTGGSITQSSIFGTANTMTTSEPSVASTQPSAFGTNTSSTTQQSSVFGVNTPANQTTMFGKTSGSAPAQISIFGTTNTSASTIKPSVFGATSTPATQSSLFAVSSNPSTTSSLFGTPTTATSPFGSAFTSTSTSASSPFGQPNSVFGTTKTTASPFSTTFGSPGLFGSTTVTTASIFGQPASFGSTTTSVFGTPTTTTNIFGSTPAGSTFGSVSSSANVFGSSAVSPPSISFAGAAGNTSNTGAFGFGSLNVGDTATTSSSVFGGGPSFGQTTAASANPFGRVTEQKSLFGGNTSIFGTPASTTNSIFGSNTSTFGSNSQSGFGNSAFGSSSAFGQQPAFGQSAFGSSSFGNSQSQPGPFSGGSAAVGQSGFGSSPSFQNTAGFGAAPVFGGSQPAAFGAAPSFGGAPAFGSTPAFGSPTKVFGSNTPTGGFGAAASGSPGFGNIANQSTVGFGNLAQQAATSSSTPFSGSPSFSSWR